MSYTVAPSGGDDEFPFVQQDTSIASTDIDDRSDLGIPAVSPTTRVPVPAAAIVTGSGASRQGIQAGGYVSKSVAAPVMVSGAIAQSRDAPPAYQVDTLDEPVSTTILRDLKNVGSKVRQVLIPYGQKDILRNWDLWGPLLLCLSLAITLSISTTPEQSAIVFTGIFVIVWVGSAVVTLNSKLLGGKISFFQSVCVLGYCIFPLVISAALNSLLFKKNIILRSIVTSVSFVWATYASIGFLSERSLENRRTLAVYPICLFYFIIGWIVLIAPN